MFIDMPFPLQTQIRLLVNAYSTLEFSQFWNLTKFRCLVISETLRYYRAEGNVEPSVTLTRNHLLRQGYEAKKDRIC
jgi:hypothetical protein